VRTDGTDASSIESRLDSLEERLGGRNLKDLEAKLNEALHKLKISDLAGANYFNSADTAFMLQCFVFTLLMTLPGLALFYGGLVRVQNVLSIVMQVC
jgi:Amt family ammonium transporter